jgi:hypothetical protein
VGELAKICFTEPLTKTVSKHVTGNHGYSIYNKLKFAFEAALNVHLHLRKIGGSGVLPLKLFIFLMLN